MITAMEIRNQQFSKSLRGFNEEEVKKFIQQLAQDYETLYSENARLRERVQKIEYELDHYRKIETTMNNSLILAQQTAEAVKVNAQKEAELMMQEGKRHVSEILMVYQEVIKRLGLFNIELKSQLTSELELVNSHLKKTDEMSSYFYSKDLKSILESLDKVGPKDKD